MSERADLEVQMLNEARAEVAIADQKAGVVFAAAGIGFAAVLGGLLAGSWRPSDYDTVGEVVWWIAVAFAFGVVLSGAVALWPRFTTRSEHALVTYWGHVARYAKLDDLEAALKDSPVDRERTRHQLWRLAKIVRKKYWCIRCALCSGGIATVLFIAAGIVG